MKKTTGYVLLLAFIFSLSMTSCNEKKETQVTLKATPEEVLQKMINNPAFVQNPNGENFCWQARVGMDQYVSNYELAKDTKWLDAGVKYYEFLISKLIVDPDGYKGWIGEYGYDSRYFQDALVGDAILMSGMLDFCILVNENDQLKAKYGAKANEIIGLAKKDFIEKWDKRGCWIDDAPFGAYIGFNKYLKADNLKQWILAPEVSRSGISHPFNKQEDVAEVCLQLHRLTGDKFYWNRAESIFLTAKYHFQYFDNHYCWNYFEPLWIGDVDLEHNTTKHFVDVHPWRAGYQAGEVGKIVLAYNYGCVFDETDIKRIINTNLNVMWNKDKVNPKYISSNGLGADGDTVGLADFKRTYGHSNVVKYEGQLWTSLSDFDQTIRDLSAARFKGDTTSERYQSYKKRMAANPVSFKRKYVKGDVTIPVVNFTESRDLYCAVVLPHNIKTGEKSVIICKSRKPGDLQVDLYSADGKLVTTLFKGKMKEEFYTMTWDGKDPSNKTKYSGEYKIRWTTAGGYREFPVVVL
jgi:hypothetical protein